MHLFPPQGIFISFDGSFDGFLCVVHDVYYMKLKPSGIQCTQELTLAQDIHVTKTDLSKAETVLSAISKKISEKAASRVYYGFLSHDPRRFMPLLEYIRLGFRVGHMVDSHLHEDCVRTVHDLARQSGKEAHLLNGFCRFQETSQGVLYAQVSPRNDVLVLLAEHFRERLMNEAWIIHDKGRRQAAVYDGSSYIITPAGQANFTLAEGEAEMQELWAGFFKTIAIKERTNKKLQRQLLPMYFRRYMTEFFQMGAQEMNKELLSHQLQK